MKKVIYILSLLIVFSCGGDEEEGTTNNNIAPNPPNLLSPSNGTSIDSQLNGIQVYFEWTQATDPDNDVTGYRLWLDTDPNFINPSYHGAVETHLLSWELETNKTYYWRVTAIDSHDNWSVFSETWSFHLYDESLLLPVPTLVYPLDETACSNNSLQFEWNPVTDPQGQTITYDFYIDESPDFNVNPQIYATTNTYYPLNMSESTHYYWKVKARSNSTSSEFSEIRSLYTQGAGATNTVPYIEYINPQNNAELSGNTVTVFWQGTDTETATNNLKYRVYFAENTSDFNLLENDYYNTQYTFNGLNSGTTYKWMIYVTDEDGATSVGDVYRFTIN